MTTGDAGTPTNTNTQTWQEVELLGMQHYVQHGWRVLTPLIETHHYDFVIEKDGVFKRVNVKLAGYKSPGQLSISQASGSAGKKKPSDVVDIYLAWIPTQQRFIELPGDFLDSTTSKSRGIPMELIRKR